MISTCSRLTPAQCHPGQKALLPHPNVRTMRHCRKRAVVCKDSLDGSTKTTSVDQLKADIMRAVSNTNRGKATTAQQRARILSLINKLEEQNRATEPAHSPLLSGWWALLYQAPLDENRAKVDKSGAIEGPFLAEFQDKPVTKDIVRTKNNLQLIDLPHGRVENLAEFTVAGQLGGSLNIIGTAVVEEQQQGLPCTKVFIEFKKFELKLGPLQLTIPLDWVKPKGWVQTTYLDDDMRVGRGDKGSIFVTARIKDRAPRK